MTGDPAGGLALRRAAGLLLVLLFYGIMLLREWWGILQARRRGLILSQEEWLRQRPGLKREANRL